MAVSKVNQKFFRVVILLLFCSLCQIIATDKLENMITFLVNKSQDDVPVSVVREGAVNLVSAVFNILMSASLSADFTRDHLTQEDDRNKVSFSHSLFCSSVETIALEALNQPCIEARLV